MINRRVHAALWAGFWVLLFWPSAAFAAVTDLSSFGSVTNTMVSFLADVDAVITAVFADGTLSGFVYRLWTFFTILLISWFIFDYIFGEVTLRQLFDLVLTIGITKVLIDYYDSLTSAFWEWSIGFAEGIQMVAVGNTDLFFLPSYIFNLVSSLSFSGISFFSSSATVIVAVLLGYGLTVGLGIVAVLTATWSIWGYAVAKMIGWMFVPTLMFKRLEWLFDGWLRFFFGFLLYNVIARVNLILVALVFKGLTGAAAITPLGMSPVQVVVDGVQDVMGLFCFLLIGIVALLSTGKFAMTLAGGGAGAGGGGLVRAAVAFATKGLK
jgi:hypothetical protein